MVKQISTCTYVIQEHECKKKKKCVRSLPRLEFSRWRLQEGKKRLKGKWSAIWMSLLLTQRWELSYMKSLDILQNVMFDIQLSSAQLYLRNAQTWVFFWIIGNYQLLSHRHYSRKTSLLDSVLQAVVSRA